MKFFAKNWDFLLCIAIGFYIASKEDDVSFFGIVFTGLLAGVVFFAIYTLFRAVLGFNRDGVPDPEEVKRRRKEFNKLDLGGYVSPKEDREFRKEQAEIKRRNRSNRSGFTGGWSGTGGLF